MAKETPSLTSPPALDSAPAKNCAPQGAPVAESDLARSLGLAREDLKKLRGQLTLGEHWEGGSGKTVVITTAGQARLLDLLGESAGDGTQAALDALQRPDRYTTLVVVKIGNPRILHARPVDADPQAEPCRVMVRQTALFCAGMKLERCEASASAPGTYYYHGRLPRSKGRF